MVFRGVGGTRCSSSWLNDHSMKLPVPGNKDPGPNKRQ